MLGLSAIGQFAIGEVDDQVQFVDKWLLSWSEPVRHKPRLATAKQAFNFLTERDILFVPIDKWLFQWPNPVRVKRGLSTPDQMMFQYPILAFELVYIRRNLYTQSPPSLWVVRYPQ